jgi:hypothetical protein
MVKLKKPAAAELDLQGRILFPTQHSLAILATARAGGKRLKARIFDGSEQGRGVYQTYSFIGARINPHDRFGAGAGGDKQGKGSKGNRGNKGSKGSKNGERGGRGGTERRVSEKKEKTETTGKKDAAIAEHERLKRLGLDRQPSWPVAISYYETNGREDAVPSYELSFLLHANGVSRKLHINYGEFSVTGRLDKLEYLPSTPCHHH